MQVPQGTGSGFIWDLKGHVVTNFHVIRGASDIKVALIDSSVYPAKVDSHAEIFCVHCSTLTELMRRPVHTGLMLLERHLRPVGFAGSHY